MFYMATALLLFENAKAFMSLINKQECEQTIREDGLKRRDIFLIPSQLKTKSASKN